MFTVLLLMLLPTFALAQPTQPAAPPAKPAATAPASSMVVVWPASKEFHSPSCPLIKDAKDVSVLLRGQANAKGMKQHADCDPAVLAEKDAPPTVFVAESDKVYHRADCKVLPKDAKKVVLDEKAVKGRWPCTVCRPPVRAAGPKAFNR